MKKIVVIGAGAAGAKAASKAKRLNPKNHVEIFTQSSETSVSLCGLPYYIEGTVKDINDLIIRTPEEFLKNGIPVYTNYKLNKIIPEKNCVIVNDNPVFYDELILALGARVNIPNIENVNLNNVFSLRSLKEGIEIREKMLESKTVLLIGGGYIAIELMQAFVANGLNVSLIEHNHGLLKDFDDEMSDIIKDSVENRCKDKVKLHFNKKVIKFTSDEEGNFKSAITQDGLEIFADFCILSTGIKPNVEIARDAGIKLGVSGAIYVDNKMRTSYKNIYACGDCAQKYCIITKKPTYLGLGTIANKEGRIAGINAVGEGQYEFFDGILSSSITSFFEYTFSKTGLSEKRASELSKEINIEPISATVTKKDKAGYMPNSNNMTIKLVADKRSGELIGAQAIGCASVIQRINTVTSLLKTKAAVDDLLDLDLPYAPPFSGSVDPILTAAYQLKDKLRS